MSRVTRVAVVCITLFLVSLLGAASLQAGPLAQLPRPPRDDASVHFQQPSSEADRQLAEPAVPLTPTAMAHGARSPSNPIVTVTGRSISPTATARVKPD